ncbi:MAG: hypothetical protein CVT63_02930 [Candidatus Anoxymicrobium japonicum]|uniref:Phosphohydrolase n=1 Tax=Candidatus Anoxymicrobium japonicum TaxID=2013648 RepID=A0A2N3G757_9ACTN|nr:MAG: hypothetical protein CVT63_02930 [Candidatus Anoxymicrobium japonicum]
MTANLVCPGQNTLFWKPEDVFETPCPACGYNVEFFKGDPTRKCPECGFRFPNPRLDMGCLEWCPYADRCAAALADGGVVGRQIGEEEEEAKDD